MKTIGKALIVAGTFMTGMAVAFLKDEREIKNLRWALDFYNDLYSKITEDMEKKAKEEISKDLYDRISKLDIDGDVDIVSDIKVVSKSADGTYKFNIPQKDSIIPTGFPLNETSPTQEKFETFSAKLSKAVEDLGGLDDLMEHLGYSPDEEEDIEVSTEWDEKGIHIISLEEWNAPEPEYEKETLIYYDDDVVADESDTVIFEWKDLIGEDALVSFGEKSQDSDIIYVRNNELKTDYEVIREKLSYNKTVLGIDPEYENARKFFNLDDREE